jgi:predicted RNA-binding protein with PIN domain
MHIIIDGYNLIRQSISLRRYEKAGLEEGRKALLRWIEPYRRRRGHRVTVVFDGWIGGSSMEERDREGGVDVVYSRRGEKADEVVKRLAESSGEEVLVVSSDREIASFVERRGKTVISAPDFEAAVDRITRMDLSGDVGGIGEDADDDEAHPRSAGKKGPSRRLSKKERAYRQRVGKL